ncbi:MAG TPA: hypothetical protein VI603_12535 [Saprospiraceae bacterium]|nr:hypothetical protein [Saprospiraceae bacterium]
METPYWQFDTIHGREDDVSNALIEMFEGDYNYYLAREVLQNAIDAHDPKSSEPVKVTFSLEEYRHSMFPGYNDFLAILNSAKSFWPKEKEKCHIFLDNAITCLTQQKIPVLKISDYNTIGLNGDDSDKNSPWYGLVKSVGSTTKHEGEGGSFGLGKGAPFAASFLRTLFYSTKNERSQNVFQGVAELVSHKDTNGNTKRGSGSFGKINQSSIRDRRLMDEHMVRKEKGLDIFIMGYKVEENWQEKLMESVLRNFWPAVNDNLLVVEIDGERLSNKNLEEKLTEYYIDKPYKDNAKPEGNPLQFYQAVKNGYPFSVTLENLGDVTFYFYRTEEPLNKVAMIRKSKMVIFSRDFRWHAPFAGVFICDNDKGNQELRKMESPQHDVWDKNRYKLKGEEIEAELRDFIRSALKSLVKVLESGITEIPALHKYLPFNKDGYVPGVGGDGAEYTGNESDEETSMEIGINEEFYESIEVTPYKVAVINKPIKGYGAGAKVIRKGKRKLKKGRGAQGGGEGNNDALLQESISSRIFLIKKSGDESLYRLIVKSDLTGKCKLKLNAIGEEGSENVFIKEVYDDNGNKYPASGHRIQSVQLTKNTELRLNVNIESNIKLSLKLEAYALQQ